MLLKQISQVNPVACNDLYNSSMAEKENQFNSAQVAGTGALMFEEQESSEEEIFGQAPLIEKLDQNLVFNP